MAKGIILVCAILVAYISAWTTLSTPVALSEKVLSLVLLWTFLVIVFAPVLLAVLVSNPSTKEYIEEEDETVRE